MIDIQSNQLPVADCVECGLKRIPAPAALRGRPAVIKGVRVEFAVGSDGVVHTKSMSGVPDRATAHAISEQIDHWIIAPPDSGTSAPTHVDLILMCAPSFGGATSDCIVNLPRSLGLR